MPGRSYPGASTADYRYGFNDKEKDNEVDGEGNTLDYGARVNDTRIGRFFSVDPLTKDYPELTPYQFASNTPIWANDLDGKEANYLWNASGLDPNATGTNAWNQTRAVLEPGIKKVGKALLYGYLMLITMGDYEAVAASMETRSVTTEGAAIMSAEENDKVLSEGAGTKVTEAAENHKAVSNEVSTTKEANLPKEPYDRKKHYGDTPTKQDRKALNAKENEVVDHKTPLVQHYYDGEGPGTKPGYEMTDAERKAFAKDRSNMQVQPEKESQSQGGKLSKYSKDKKKEFKLDTQKKNTTPTQKKDNSKSK